MKYEVLAEREREVARAKAKSKPKGAYLAFVCTVVYCLLIIQAQYNKNAEIPPYLRETADALMAPSHGSFITKKHVHLYK